MRPVNLLIVPMLCFFISCVPTQQSINWGNSLEIANAIEIEYDEFEKVTRYIGPFYDPPPYGGGEVFIRAWKYETRPVIKYQIYVRAFYDGDWRYYEWAYDSDGKKLDTIVIDREVVDCTEFDCYYYEHIGINVDREYLENHQYNGIRFKVKGRAGEQIFSIPPTYIIAFLNITGAMRTIEDVNTSKSLIEMKEEGQTKQEQNKTVIGYRAKKDSATGKYITYPVYDDEKK